MQPELHAERPYWLTGTWPGYKSRSSEGSTSLAQTLTGQIAAGTSGAGVSLANTAVSANVAPNSGAPGAETVGVVNPYGYSSPKGAAVSFAMQAVDSNTSQLGRWN